MAVLPGCHQIMVRLLNHFIQQFFWEDTTTSGNTFKLFVDFSGQFQRDGTISMRIPLYSITDWHRSPISDSHPFDQP
ncbi:TPA: hypothetical protein ACH9WA_005175, partial [Escherichia coli]